MKPVTDPSLLAQLNADSGKPVTDPGLLAQLNGEQADSSMLDVAKYAAMAPVMQPYQATKSAVQNPETIPGHLPFLGAVGGEMLGGPLGSAIGAGVGQIGKRIGDIGFGNVQPGDAMSPGMESLAPMGQTLANGLPGVGGVKNAVQGVAQDLGRRALGIAKGMIKRTPGGIDTANQAAQEMLDKGVIKFGSSAKTMLGRAQDVAEQSGQAIGDTLKSVGGSPVNTQDVAQEVLSQLTPKYTGGMYDTQNKLAGEVFDTIMAHGEGPIDMQSAQTLKNTLKQAAGNNWNTDKMKAAMYQKAYGIVSDALEKGVESATPQVAESALPVAQAGLKTGDPHALFAYKDQFGPGGAERSIYNVFGDGSNPSIQKVGWGSSVPREVLDQHGIPITGRQANATVPENLLPRYMAAKKTYGASQRAIEGLGDKASAEASNSILSLRGAAIGAGALASGHITPALEGLGAWEAARRLGTGAASAALNAANNSPISGSLRAALLSELITRITDGKQGGQ